MRTRIVVVGAAIACAILLPGAAASAQAPSPPLTECYLTTSELRLIRMTPLVPVEFSTVLLLKPQCDELPGDPRTATIDWGDGTVAPATLEPGPEIRGYPSVILAGRHAYASAPPPGGHFKIDACTANGRTGAATLCEGHYAAISDPPPMPDPPSDVPRGCGALTASAQAPAAGLQATATFRSITSRAVLVLVRPTQLAVVRARAYAMGGRRVDDPEPVRGPAADEPYGCTTPRATNRLALRLKPAAVRSLRRHGRLTVRVRLVLVNALGATATVRRTVVVRVERPRATAGAR